MEPAESRDCLYSDSLSHLTINETQECNSLNLKSYFFLNKNMR